ncbi:glycosyltransferase [Paenibacillus sp. A3M_27_13]|uniref:CgeB family protein n=1 Tax=Paenibacillus sp. A3M_27_13 TaxID=2962029 RepID=UPI0020B7364C|nr:glycosyltransferase [Paenibacillus sp. A3M_27_13]MCP3746735.1 glycosyltransferase [Paenibacillus sp. A3M_27_13]
MKVLFLENHPMWIHGLPNGFRALGHTVKISGALTKSKLPWLLKTFKPDLVISMGWTPEHAAYKQNWVRKYVASTNIPHVYWATEDPTHHESFSLPYVRTVKPDFIFTICHSMVSNYKKMGIRAAHMDFGYHPKVHKEGKAVKSLKRDIAIVANGYSRILKIYPKHFRIKSIRNLIRPLIQDGKRVDFWGKQWEMMKPILGIRIPSKWIHGYLPYPDAHKVYNSAKIVIGPQNQLTQVTQRTYEILGSGGFLITSDTPEIRRLFKPGRDLVVSSSGEQTRKLVDYYLRHPEERERIQKQGKLAVRKHSYTRRARYMIRCLQKYKII